MPDDAGDDDSRVDVGGAHDDAGDRQDAALDEDGSVKPDDAAISGEDQHCAPGTFVKGYSQHSRDALYFHDGELVMNGTPNHALGCWDDLKKGRWFTAAQTAGVAGMPMTITSIPLAVPIQAASRYALSVSYSFTGPVDRIQFELYGTNAECGNDSTAHLLDSTPFINGEKLVACFDFTSSESYSHVLLVRRDLRPDDPAEQSSMLNFDATFCPTGTCGN